MVTIRHVSIQNFRGLHAFEWRPGLGVNCLVGPGDSGKSTILDAIELCLSDRRNARFTDADFHKLTVDRPIVIDVTIADLEDALLNLDGYGDFLRSYNEATGAIEDEPEKTGVEVLTVRLRVEDDLDPTWTLYSDRAEKGDKTGVLRWEDRRRLVALRIGSGADYDLSWRQGSVFTRLAGQEADISSALAKAARQARIGFGKEANEQLATALEAVKATAKDMGVPVGDSPQALLDPAAVALNGGAIALHAEDGTPLRVLGLGSLRLLVAGLRRRSTEGSSVVLVDEVEHGLEPHRILRLLHALGSKDNPPKMQVFMTTHSPVTVRELSHRQLHVIRRAHDVHLVLPLAKNPEIQGTIRRHPEALLARSVLVCEGASEEGLVRGIDLHRTAEGGQSLTARGVALVDGGGISQVYRRALDFMELGHRSAVIRDNDALPNQDDAEKYKEDGGNSFVWHDKRALEDELFSGLTTEGVGKLLDAAIVFLSESLVDDHIKSASSNAMDVEKVRTELFTTLRPQTREVLAKASKGRNAPWFKTVGRMEEVGRTIVAPDLPDADAGFRKRVEDILAWIDTE